MLTTLTMPPLNLPAGKTIQPNRFPPQSEAAPPTQRFAELLQHRRETQPQAKSPAPAPAPEPRPGLKTEPKAKPIARAPGDDNGHTDAADDGAQTGENTSADDTTLQASAGSTTTKTRPSSKAGTPPSGNPRDLPITEWPMLPPTLVDDSPTLSGDPAATSGPDVGADGTDRTAATPAMPNADPPFWPGMPITTNEAGAATATHAALAGGGNGAAELRIGAGSAAPGGSATAQANLTLAGGSAGQHSAGQQGAGDQGSDAAADRAAALLAAAVSQAEGVANATATATVNATVGRFALPARAPGDQLALPAWAGGIASHRLDGGTTAPVALPTPLTSPDFAKALGAQVSLFARNGLAQAELHLTPAEMGPIRVQIAIDGALARVDFAADSAATRQVIERGLPELASALREQGLTLSGGGVFQQAPDQRDNGEAERKISRVGQREPTAAPEAAARPSPARANAAHPGAVDLYA